MTPQISIQKTVYKVSDFVGWQRDGMLVLSPSFQRRPVWKPIAKSFLMDTIVRGFPVPVIYIRERVDLDTQRTVREVVDGQQRLRTILSFIAPQELPDFNPNRDEFLVRATHNSDVAGKPFARLPAEVRSAVLGYEFSVHILASGTDDRDILQMFARINSTGIKLNPQELRNAEYFGAFKTSMYRLALEQLERWRDWHIFTEDQIARMKEVELTSDLAINMITGIVAKRQPTINKWYERYDDEFPGEEEVERRFRRVFDDIEDAPINLAVQIGGSLFQLGDARVRRRLRNRVSADSETRTFAASQLPRPGARRGRFHSGRHGAASRTGRHPTSTGRRGASPDSPRLPQGAHRWRARLAR